MNTEVENRIYDAFGFHDPLKKLRPKVPDNLLDGVDDKKASNNYQAERNGSQWNPRLKRKLESDITDVGSNPQERPRMDGDWPTVSGDQQTFSSTCSERSEANNDADRSCDQEIPGSTSECKTKESDGKVTDASPDSEECPLPDTDSNSWDLPSDTDSSDGDSEECSPIDDNQTVCTSDWGSEGDSSGSLDYFFPSEEGPPLMKLGIPLITDEERLVEKFWQRWKVYTTKISKNVKKVQAALVQII